MKPVSVGAVMRVFHSLSLFLSSLLAVFHKESAVVLLEVLFGESDQGLQVLRSAADVSVCLCVSQS